MYENNCVLQTFSKSRSIFVKNHCFSQNCDFEGLGEEGEQTDTPTDARINRLESGWWWWDGGGEGERGGAVSRVWMREWDDRINRL